MAVVRFNRFSVAVYASWSEKNYPCLIWHFDLYFKPGMQNFATAALFRRIEVA